ncbi:MAG TPA: PepSY-associated TM helix domain-containing protein [Caulobacteraceae bacterium]|nr:PepSY-associated TM helix domain-containing protein [Caulobacteraceae bacterium]
MRFAKAIHRFVTVFVVLVTLYLGVTGTLIQLVDLRSIFTHAPATDPNVMAMRESFNGPANYQVITTGDYSAPALPAGADLAAMLGRVMSSARSAFGAAPLRYVELRMAGGKPIGQIKAPDGVFRFDGQTGAGLGAAPAVGNDEFGSPASDRNTVKRLHRMTTFGDWALYINVVVGVGLGVLIVTGLIIYWKMMVARARNGKSGVYWVAGGWWRTLHRAIALTASAFLVVVTLSGTWLAVESLGFGLYMASHRPPRPPGAQAVLRGPGGGGGPAVGRGGRQRPPGGGRDRDDGTAAPLRDGQLQAMLQTTIGGYRAVRPSGQIKVIRLRYFAGMPQGVIITGGQDDQVQQLVFNASTGKPVSETEPGYPPTGFPFGWQAHETAKNVHRGDIIGLPGRFMDLFAGLSMIYLSVSGIWIYVEMWSRRRKIGQRQVIWS